MIKSYEIRTLGVDGVRLGVVKAMTKEYAAWKGARIYKQKVFARKL